MPKISQRIIHSISTGPQPSEPLPKDVIIGPAAGSSGSQFIQRSRYIYRWSNRQECVFSFVLGDTLNRVD